MASRLATRNLLNTARLATRPSATPLTLPGVHRAVSAVISQQRYQSGPPQQDPKSRAQAILDALPGSSLISKTAILSTGAGLSVAAISNELYVLNEESIVMFATLSVVWAIYHYLGPSYASWADGYSQKIKGILDTARQDHKDAVQVRIDEVKKVGGVVDITKDLFAVSKETAQLEAQAYELQQKTTLAAEAKTVLDSWVRYEDQLKQRMQRELADTVIQRVEKDLDNPRVLKQILDQSVAEVERIVSQKPKSPTA